MLCCSRSHSELHHSFCFPWGWHPLLVRAAAEPLRGAERVGRCVPQPSLACDSQPDAGRGAAACLPAFAGSPRRSCLFQVPSKNRASHCLQNENRMPQATDKLLPALETHSYRANGEGNNYVHRGMWNSTARLGTETQQKKQADLQLDNGDVESFLCGCCSACVCLKSPYAAFQLLLLVCVVPVERMQCFQTAACRGWDLTTHHPKQF